MRAAVWRTKALSLGCLAGNRQLSMALTIDRPRAAPESAAVQSLRNATVVVAGASSGMGLVHPAGDPNSLKVILMPPGVPCIGQPNRVATSCEMY